MCDQATRPGGSPLRRRPVARIEHMMEQVDSIHPSVLHRHDCGDLMPDKSPTRTPYPAHLVQTVSTIGAPGSRIARPMAPE